MGGNDIGVFVAQAITSSAVWALQSDQGVEASQLVDGERAIPFWSTLAKAARSATLVPEFHGRLPVRIELHAWLKRWLPMMDEGGLLVGIDWVGPFSQGFEVSPSDLAQAFEGCEPVRRLPELRRRSFGPM